MTGSVPAPVERWLTERGFGSVTRVEPVGGGCINNGVRLATGSKETFFLKMNPGAPVNMFACEARALRNSCSSL